MRYSTPVSASELSTHTAVPPPAPKARCGASWRWNLLYGSAALIGWPIMLYRRWVKGKDREGFSKKWGNFAPRSAHSQRIWVHAVSVGETNAAVPLIAEVKKQLPNAELVVSTTTDTGQNVARQRFGADNVIYYPYDFSWSVRRAFERLQPNLIVLMELEVWPNLTAEAAARGIPVVVVNGRITARSGGRYKKFWWLVGGSFRRVTRWLTQNDEYAARLKDLGVEPARVEVGGNVKYDAVETRSITPEERSAARKELGLTEDARVLFGGSTHPSEEGTLLAAYAKLRATIPTLRLVLCPRHPERLPGVVREIESAGFAVLRRSALKEKGAAALDMLPAEQRTQAVVLIDTMGELGRLYRAADLVFVGGSLIPHGGQSVMEPAGLGLPAVFGPHMHNFAEAVQILKTCEGAVQVSGADAVPGALEKFLTQPEAARAMGARAQRAFVERQGASKKCVAYLASLLT